MYILINIEEHRKRVVYERPVTYMFSDILPVLQDLLAQGTDSDEVVCPVRASWDVKIQRNLSL